VRGSAAPGKRPSEEDKSSADTAAELFALYGRSTDSEKSRKIAHRYRRTDGTDSDEVPIMHKTKARRSVSRPFTQGESFDQGGRRTARWRRKSAGMAKSRLAR